MRAFLLAVVLLHFFASLMKLCPRLDYIPAREFIAGLKCNPDAWKLPSPIFNLVFPFDRGIWRVFRSPGSTARRFPRGGRGRSKPEVHPEEPANAALALNGALRVTE